MSRSVSAPSAGGPGVAATYRATAEAACRWVLDQVRWDDGPWIPTTGSTAGPSTEQTTGPTTGPTTDPTTGPVPPADRDGLHSGIGGPAHLLAEIRITRAWTPEEELLATGVGDRLADVVDGEVDLTYFDGLVSHLGALGVLGHDTGIGAEVDRLVALGDTEGWPQTAMGPPRYRDGARVNDATLGTAGVLLGAGPPDAELVPRPGRHRFGAGARRRRAGPARPARRCCSRPSTMPACPTSPDGRR